MLKFLSNSKWDRNICFFNIFLSILRNFFFWTCYCDIVWRSKNTVLLFGLCLDFTRLTKMILFSLFLVWPSLHSDLQHTFWSPFLFIIRITIPTASFILHLESKILWHHIIVDFLWCTFLISLFQRFLWHCANFFTNSYKWLLVIRTSIFGTPPYFKRFLLSLGVVSLLEQKDSMARITLKKKRIMYARC